MSWQGLGEVAVIDVETTGLEPDTDRILSISIALIDLDEQETLVTGHTAMFNPDRSISLAASRVNGITARTVANKPRFAEEAQELRDLIGTRELVGHNVSFDKRFLNAEFKRAGVKTLHRNRSHCTMQGTCEALFEIAEVNRRRISLNDALKVLGLAGRHKDIHSALEDVQLTTHLAQKLWELEVLPRKQTKDLRHSIRQNYKAHSRKRTAETNAGLSGGKWLFWFIVIILLFVWLSD